MSDQRTWEELLAGMRLESLRPNSPDVSSSAADERAALEAAGFRAMAERAVARGIPLTVVVNDAHRFTDTAAFFDAMFALLGEAGVEPALRMLVAQGTHRSTPFERSAHEERIAAPYLRRFDEIAWHDADEASGLVSLEGFEFHRWMTEGGAYVACGSMEPHYFAGVTGAHKTLTVGVLSRRAIEANHANAMSEDAQGLRLAGNPVHEGIAAAVAALERSGAELLALNQIVVDGRSMAAVAGTPLGALDAGLPWVRSCFSRAPSEPADVLIASVGPPLDRDLYQADKGIKNTEAAVRDGGTLIVEAECAQGIGIDHFLDLLRHAPTHADALKTVAERGYRLGDHKAVRLRALTDLRNVAVALVSPNVDPDLGATLGMSVFADRSSAARWLLDRVDADPNVVLVEDAGNLTLELAVP